MAFKRVCIECGETFEAKRAHGEYCKIACRKEFNNRRAVRGAELYDLIMTSRFDRDFAKAEGIQSLISSLAGAYRDADKAKRGGRRSWDKQAHRKLPLAFNPHVGDDR